MAIKRLKFEELFIAQVRMQLVRAKRHHQSAGVIFEKVGDYFNQFYSSCLPFELTGGAETSSERDSNRHSKRKTNESHCCKGMWEVVKRWWRY